jgi:hypothetical protein
VPGGAYEEALLCIYVCRHWIVSEGLPYANGRWVPNKRDAFKFGTSTAGLLSDGIAALQVRECMCVHACLCLLHVCSYVLGPENVQTSMLVCVCVLVCVFV